MISSIPIVENKSKSMVIFMFYNIYTAFCFASPIICITFAGVLKNLCLMKKSIILMMSAVFALCMVSCVPNEGKVIKKDFTHFLKVNGFDGILTNFAYAEITDRVISTSERTGLPLPEGFLDKEVGKKYIIRLDYYFDDEYGIDADFMYLVHIEHAEYGAVIDELDVVYHWMADRVEWKQIELDK